jgi:hypothetical protein
VHKIDWTCNAYVMVAGKVAESDRLGELGIDGRTTAIIRIITLTFHFVIFSVKKLIYFTLSSLLINLRLLYRMPHKSGNIK